MKNVLMKFSFDEVHELSVCHRKTRRSLVCLDGIALQQRRAQKTVE